jgi:hypothetical protein
MKKTGASTLTKNRSHPKIGKLPPELQRIIEDKLLDSFTYQQIAEYLKGLGHEISESAVYRFGAPFLKTFEHLRAARAAARLVAEDNIDRPPTELQEANNALASQLIMLSLVDENMDADDKLKNVKLIAALQQAQVQNERLKLEAHKVSGIVKTAMDLLRREVYETIGEEHPDIAAAIIRIADESEVSACRNLR